MGNLINLQKFSLQAGSNPTLVGNVSLVAGTNVTLSQTGQSITINSTGGGGGANTALSNLATVAINTALIAAANNTIDLGTTSIAFRSLYLGTNIKSGATILATTTELGYLTGVTSALQTQLDSKAPLNNPEFTDAINIDGLSFDASGANLITNASSWISTSGFSFKTDITGNTGPTFSFGTDDPDQISFGFNQVNQDAGLTIDTNATAGETNILIFDISNQILQRISIGDPDSGGIGFRVLRIPN